MAYGISRMVTSSDGESNGDSRVSSMLQPSDVFSTPTPIVLPIISVCGAGEKIN